MLQISVLNKEISEITNGNNVTAIDQIQAVFVSLFSKESQRYYTSKSAGERNCVIIKEIIVKRSITSF